MIKERDNYHYEYQYTPNSVDQIYLGDQSKRLIGVLITLHSGFASIGKGRSAFIERKSTPLFHLDKHSIPARSLAVSIGGGS